MKTHNLSRRRLLGGLLATLTAWLCPRPPRADAAPRRSHALALPPWTPSGYTCTYTYDGRGRLVSETEEPSRPLEPSPCLHGTSEPENIYTYDGG